MPQKYEVYHEVGWDEKTGTAKYERLKTIKNEKEALAFANSIENIGKYGNMRIEARLGGVSYTYNEKTESWEPKK